LTAAWFSHRINTINQHCLDEHVTAASIRFDEPFASRSPLTGCLVTPTAFVVPHPTPSEAAATAGAAESAAEPFYRLAN
jgi:hypothetical protein